jgi:hypothetical protein
LETIFETTIFCGQKNLSPKSSLSLPFAAGLEFPEKGPPDIVGLLAGHSETVDHEIHAVVVLPVENEQEFLPIFLRLQVLGRVLDPKIEHAPALAGIDGEILIYQYPAG